MFVRSGRNVFTEMTTGAWTITSLCMGTQQLVVVGFKQIQDAVSLGGGRRYGGGGRRKKQKEMYEERGEEREKLREREVKRRYEKVREVKIS